MSTCYGFTFWIMDSLNEQESQYSRVISYKSRLIWHQLVTSSWVFFFVPVCLTYLFVVPININLRHLCRHLLFTRSINPGWVALATSWFQCHLVLALVFSVLHFSTGPKPELEKFCMSKMRNHKHSWQGLSQDLETGCLKLAVVKILGVHIFKGDHNILIFQP